MPKGQIWKMAKWAGVLGLRKRRSLCCDYPAWLDAVPILVTEPYAVPRHLVYLPWGVALGREFLNALPFAEGQGWPPKPFTGQVWSAELLVPEPHRL